MKVNARIHNIRGSSLIAGWFVLLLNFGFGVGLTAQEKSVVAEEAASLDATSLVLEAELAAELNPQQTAELRMQQQAEALRLSQELQQRLDNVERLRSDLGVYDDSLIEAYAGLGSFFVENQDYAAAVKYYTDALQIARISTGLVSDEQLPIIDNLIANNSQLQQWQEVDDSQHLAYYIRSRLHDFNEREYIMAVNDYGRWKLRVIRENLLAQNGRGLSNTAADLSDFYTRNIELVELQGNPNADDLLQLFYGKSLTDVEMARSIARTPLSYFQGTESEYITQTRCQNVRNSQGVIVRQCVNVTVNNPRYRQSQNAAKQMELRRYTRSISDSAERIQALVDNNPELSMQQKETAQIHIRELETEYGQLQRSTMRRVFL
ncbi:MAG: hypothetical protein COC19_04070 [SAR86 cluster bacterium]|uniref:Uncharacterized protein n=1 Tax=SAR86 cluster bacterium TaxID=2030880 RepID=A0A2A4MPQ0_9GAMM|nr:MAG: hypothetical protein COC19_04070 [SAR86 cluster bacterium]